MIKIIIKKNEPFDVSLRRFKRSCERSGILSESRKREYYEKPSIIKKKAKISAIKRFKKKMKMIKNIEKKRRLY